MTDVTLSQSDIIILPVFLVLCQGKYEITINISFISYYAVLSYCLVIIYLTVILRGRAGYELIYITNKAVGRVGYYQLISGKSEKNNCFSKFSSNCLDFFG